MSFLTPKKTYRYEMADWNMLDSSLLRAKREAPGGWRGEAVGLHLVVEARMGEVLPHSKGLTPGLTEGGLKMSLKMNWIHL